MRFRRPTRASPDPLLLITTWKLGKSWADSIRYRSPWVRSTGLSLDTRGTSTRRAVQPALVSYGAALQCVSRKTQSSVGKANLAARLIHRLCGTYSGSKRRGRDPRQGDQQRGLLRRSHQDGDPD